MDDKALKLAKQSLRKEGKLETITFEKIADLVEKGGKNGAIIYLDRENQEKDFKKLDAFFKAKKRCVITRELRYTMDPKDIIYEVHVL